MERGLGGILAVLVAALLAPSGCGTVRSGPPREISQAHYLRASTEIEYPDVDAPLDDEILATPPPITIEDVNHQDFWDLSLEDTVKLALSQSQVLTDLGGMVLRSPETIHTVHDVAIQNTDPRFGVAAALSEFDASFATSAFFENNDRALNNQFFGGGTRLLKQDASVFQSQLTKRAATGTEFTLRNNTEYDANNAPGNAFPSAWTTMFDAEMRHPLLKGGGVNFNRIAGPGSLPGQFSGVVLARINTDISLADFELSVRDFVSEVENSYWELYFAYRDLDAKIMARNAAMETWRRIHALYLAERTGGEAEKEAQARQQFFLLEAEVQNALTGRLVEGTRKYSGSSGGSFRGSGGVHVHERKLRLLVGLPLQDGRLIRPADEPPLARIEYDWQQLLAEAVTRRVELRRQRWKIKRRELELEASRNFLYPQLDAVARYRFRGFGHDLLNAGRDGNTRFDAAINDLVTGDFQESQFGLEFSVPLGQRRGWAAVTNAEYMLARERAILREQERQVVHDLSNAVAEMQRSFAAVQTSYNSRFAARQQLEAVQAAFEVDKATLELVLDSQRRLAEAESQYYRSLVEYATSLKNVQFEKGSLLDYNGVFLSEGQWPMEALADAAERAERLAPEPDVLSRNKWQGPVVTRGPVPQLVEYVDQPQPEAAAPADELTPFPTELPPGPPAPSSDPFLQQEAMRPDETFLEADSVEAYERLPRPAAALVEPANDATAGHRSAVTPADVWWEADAPTRAAETSIFDRVDR